MTWASYRMPHSAKKTLSVGHNVHVKLQIFGYKFLQKKTQIIMIFQLSKNRKGPQCVKRHQMKVLKKYVRLRQKSYQCLEVKKRQFINRASVKAHINANLRDQR